MNRRSFLSLLAATPLLAWLRPSRPSSPPVPVLPCGCRGSWCGNAGHSRDDLFRWLGEKSAAAGQRTREAVSETVADALTTPAKV